MWDRPPASALGVAGGIPARRRGSPRTSVSEPHHDRAFLSCDRNLNGFFGFQVLAPLDRLGGLAVGVRQAKEEALEAAALLGERPTSANRSAFTLAHVRLHLQRHCTEVR